MRGRTSLEVGSWRDWWEWEIVLSPHLLERMPRRGFSESDLRLMLEVATDLRRHRVPGRWILDTRHASRRWRIVLELDPALRSIIVVTAYPAGG